MCTRQRRIQGFPTKGTPTPEVDAKSYYLAIFSQKMHEIKKIWTPRWGARPWRPLRSVNAHVY